MRCQESAIHVDHSAIQRLVALRIICVLHKGIYDTVSYYQKLLLWKCSFYLKKNIHPYTAASISIGTT